MSRSIAQHLLLFHVNSLAKLRSHIAEVNAEASSEVNEGCCATCD